MLIFLLGLGGAALANKNKHQDRYEEFADTFNRAKQLDAARLFIFSADHIS